MQDYLFNYTLDTFLLLVISVLKRVIFKNKQKEKTAQKQTSNTQTRIDLNKKLYFTRRKEMFYLTTHSTHFIYGYMASDIMW